MAVSFRVPASPKKSIFVIDDFKGVDLTNTGSNIEENKSPNAENMVRYVPGKVRKRTGYQTQITFSKGEDINRAKNTSNEWVQCEYDSNNEAVYEFYGDPIETVYVSLYAKAVGTYEFHLDYTDNQYLLKTFSGTTESIYNNQIIGYGINASVHGGAYRIIIKHMSSGEDDYCIIKGMRIALATEAENLNAWKVLPWTPAPEDSGKFFVLRTSNDPVYGCHMIKSGDFEGNRVVNVNRALATSSSFTSFSCNSSSLTTIYTLANQIYIDGSTDEKTQLCIEFDYISNVVANLFICGAANTSKQIENTSGETKHFSFVADYGSYTDYTCAIKGVSSSGTVQIKNFSVMYEKDDSYTWSPAPEDNSQEFDIEDVYNAESENKALETSYSVSASSNVSTINICDSTSNAQGFAKVAFDLHTSGVGQASSVVVRLKNTSSYIHAATKTYTKHVSGDHIEFYVGCGSATEYVKSIIVTFTGSRDQIAGVTNLTVNQITPRGSYDISSKYYLYHVGNQFYLRPSNSNKATCVYSDANKHISRSWQLNDKLLILDGEKLYKYAVGDSEAVPITSDNSYIPLVTIAKAPSGGGVSYEPLNMLQPGFYEQFCVTSSTSSATNFYLSFNNLDYREVKVWLLDSNGNWVLKTENTHYSVNRARGIIFFANAPGASPISGEDNVRVLAYRTVTGYADRVMKCTIGTLFGVGGAADRLFLSGNPDYPNWDFYSEQYDPTYFPDTGYSSLGSSASAIVGYAIVNNYLATFKDGLDTSQSVFIREGDLITSDDETRSDPAFKLINTLQGDGVVAPYSFGYLQTEPLFLTRSGIYAITAQDITGEKYSQNRSFYLNGKLLKEDNMENAMATVFNDQYVLAINGKLYILDGLQPIRTDKSEPYATRQYVGFYCTNVPANIIWTDDQVLWIGTSEGKVCKFATDIEALESYNDDGEAIYCCWETPELDGKLFYKNKTFRYFAIRMMQSLRTSVKMYSRKLGNWSLIKEDSRSGLLFDFEHIDFELFSFSTDKSERVVHTKVRVKKVDKARFRVENDNVNEPFGLFDLALEYIESGNYKG